jgi:propionyl-CoA synthetase
MLGIWENEARFKAGYFSKFDGYYLSGDGGYKDEDGYFHHGRTDDVNVADIDYQLLKWRKLLSSFCG